MPASMHAWHRVAAATAACLAAVSLTGRASVAAAAAPPADAPQRLWTAAHYPIPPATPRRLFFIQRSMNANTVVYEARLRPDGLLDAERPVDAYWLRYSSSGERRELSLVERLFAFGPVLQREGPQAWRLHAAGYDRRTARLVLETPGRPVLVGEVAGRRARLVSAYLHLAEGGSLPRVTAVDLYGIDAADGRWLHERFVP